MLASLFALSVTFLEADEVVDTKLLLQMPDTKPHEEVEEVAVLVVEVDEALLLLVVMTLLLLVLAKEEVVVVC